MKFIKLILTVLVLILSTNILEGAHLFVSDKSKSRRIISKAEPVNGKKNLDKYFSTKRLGSFVKDGKTYFRLFTPDAESVTLVTFNKPEDKTGTEYPMKQLLLHKEQDKLYF